MKSNFKALAVTALLATTMQMGLSSNASAQDVYGTQPQVTQQADGAHLEGKEVAKNVGGGAILGWLAAKVTGGNADKGAAIGLLAGIGKSIYEDVKVRGAAADEKAAKEKLAKAQPLPPVVDVAPVATTTAQEAPAVTQTKGHVFTAVPTASMKRFDDSVPRGITTTGKDGMTEISGRSTQDLVYGFGGVLRKHGVQLDIVNADADVLRQESAVGGKMSVKFKANDLPAAMNALHKLAQSSNMGMLVEDKTNYVVIADKKMVQNLMSNPALQAVGRTTGVTSAELNEALLKYQAKSTLGQTSMNMQATSPQQQGPAVYSYSQLSAQDEARRQRGMR